MSYCIILVFWVELTHSKVLVVVAYIYITYIQQGVSRGCGYYIMNIRPEECYDEVPNN